MMGSEENGSRLHKITTSQQAFCSCCGAVITSVLVTPLDVVKVRLQAQSNPSLKGKSFLDSDGLTDHVYLYKNGTGKSLNKTSGPFTGMKDAFVKIVQREGMKALWSGLPPSLPSRKLPMRILKGPFVAACLLFSLITFLYNADNSSLNLSNLLFLAFKTMFLKMQATVNPFLGERAVSVPTTVIYFTCYDQLCEVFVSKLEDNDYIPLIAGGIARLCSATIISPVEMIRTKMQSRQLTYNQLHACISSNVTKNGWLSLWKGWGPTVLRDVPFSALYWYNYESFKKTLCKEAGVHEPTILITFSSGAAAGSIAATLTLPFDVVKTHKQTELWETDVTSSSQKSTSVWRIMKRIVAENGFTGLFTGIIPRLTKIAPACAIMISTYEYGKSFFHKLNKNREVKNN